MDVGDLRIFEAVARLGGMNRAAAEVHTVQSNVTARIKALEDGLGVSLFDRTSRGVSLTDAGRRLLPYARRVLSLIAEAERATRDDGTPCGPLVFGSSESTAALRLSPILSQFVAANPQVDLTLKTGTSLELTEQVLNRDLEGAFVSGAVDHPELVEETVYTEDLVLLSAPRFDTLKAAIGAPNLRIVVLRAGCAYRFQLESLLARRGIIQVRRLEFGTLEAIIGSVSAGLGVTLLPRSFAGAVWRDGTLAVHSLPPEEALVDTVFIRRRDTHMSSALKAFMAHAQPAMQALAAE